MLFRKWWIMGIWWYFYVILMSLDPLFCFNLILLFILLSANSFWLVLYFYLLFFFLFRIWALRTHIILFFLLKLWIIRCNLFNFLLDFLCSDNIFPPNYFCGLEIIFLLGRLRKFLRILLTSILNWCILIIFIFLLLTFLWLFSFLLHLFLFWFLWCFFKKNFIYCRE